MITLGIDPGFGRTGYSVVEEVRGRSLRVKDFGCIITESRLDFAKRIFDLGEDLKKIIKRFSPDYCAIESLFFFKNLKTALKVASARGVLLYILQEKGISVFEYTPLQVKQAVTGYGRADKAQVMDMVKKILKIKSNIKLDDASDALAVAICHINSRIMRF